MESIHLGLIGHWRGFRVVIPLCLLLGCGSGTPDSSGERAAPNVFSVQVGDETMNALVGPSVRASFPDGSAGVGQIGFAVEDRFSLVVRAPMSAFPEFSAAITPGPIEPGTASANVYLMGTALPAGTVEVRIAGSRIVGSIPEADVEFEGSFVLSCRVPPQRLAQGSGTSEGGASDHVRAAVVAADGAGPVPAEFNVVDDAEFETAECAAVKGALL